MASIAQFTAEGHVYSLDGRIVPSVTQALALAGIDDVSRVPPHHLKRAAAVGTAVHVACEFLDEDDLDIESLDPAIVGYVLGYQRFKEQRGFSPILIEQRGIVSTGLPYGFCLDRIGILDDKEVLIDIKTASRKQNWWGIQVAAYAEAVEFKGERMAVHVAKDGSYQLIPHEDAADFDAWQAALEIAHWKLAHGSKLPS
jgi:hypothetical protein